MANQSSPFKFHDFTGLMDDEIEMRITQHIAADPVEGLAPAYGFHIIHRLTNQVAGGLFLRLQDSEYIRLYAGHLGYGVEPAFRGRRYALRACRLVAPVAHFHGFHELWITCNPDNWPSRRTSELLGAEYIDTVELPPHTIIYQEGDRYKCRYLWRPPTVDLQK